MTPSVYQSMNVGPMTSLTPHPTAKPSFWWSIVGPVVIGALILAITIFENPVRLRFSRDRADVLAILEKDLSWRSDIDFVSNIVAKPNFPQGKGSPRWVPNWKIDDSGGYFTFQVRGSRGPNLALPASCYIKVSFEKVRGRVSRIVSIQRVEFYPMKEEASTKPKEVSVGVRDRGTP